MTIKHITGVLAAIAVAMSVSASGAEVANEIRQIPLDAGLPVQFLYNLPDVGTQTVAAPIEGTGALFELWADGEGDDAGTKTLVDSKVIGLYMPKGDFVVDILDDWRGFVTEEISGNTVTRPVYRTRADQPYSVTGSVTDLLTDPEAPRAAREVNFLRYATSVEEGAGYYVDPDNEETILSLVFTGSDTYPGDGPSLSGFADSRLMNGQEKFEMLSYADETVPQRWNVGSATVKIFPAGSGTFMQRDGSGGQEPFNSPPVFTPRQVFTDKVPPIFVHYTAVYPDSMAYVQIYKGEPALGTIGTIVPGTTVDALDAAEPQDTASLYTTEEGDSVGITVSDAFLRKFFDANGNGNGVYTLEIVNANLPPRFIGVANGTQRLAYISFEIKNSVKVRGQIGTKQ